MSDLLQYAVLAAGTAGLFVWLALGVVVVHRGSGILNFAQGAYVMFAAHLFHELRTTHDLPLTAAAVLTTVVTAAIGFGTYWMVIRPLGHASLVSRVVATLGVVVVVTEFVRLLWERTDLVETVLPTDSVAVLGTEVTIDRVLYLGLALVATVVLWAGYRFTTAGLAAAGVAENQRAAAALGWSPDAIAGTSWAIAGTLAGIAGVIVAPAQPTLDRNSFVLLVVPALAAALIAGFRSLPLAALAAVGLAVVQQDLSGTLVADHPDIRGIEQSVPLLVIVVVLVLRGRGLPTRGHQSERRPALGSGGVPLRVVLPVAAVAIVGTWTVLPPEWVDAVGSHATLAIVLLSLVVVLGYAGQLSLGQVAFAGIAALVAGRLVATQDVPFGVAALIGLVAALVAGVVFALPALRTRGLSLAIVTLGLGVAVNALLFTRTYFSPAPEGSDAAFGFGVSPEGTRVAGRVALFGIDLDRRAHPETWTTFCVVIFAVLAMLVATLRRGRAGRRLIAVRTNERAAASLGINVAGAKLYAFGLSAFIAGVGGILLSFRDADIRFSEDFNPFQSIVLAGFVVVGGVGYVIGPLLGAALLPGAAGSALGRDLSAWLADIGEPRPWISAVLVVAVTAPIAGRVLRRSPARWWAVPGSAAVAAAIGAVGSDAVGSVLGAIDDLVALAPWIGALLVGLGVRAIAGAVAARVSRAPRMLGPAALLAGTLVSRALLDDEVAGWMADSERYLPLVGGIAILVIMLQDGDGQAAELVHRVHRLAAARPRRPAAAPVTQQEPTGGPATARVAPRRLEVRGLEVRFGAVVAADQVTFEVSPGEVVGLIGPNGAGKTTIVDAVTGYLKPTAGQIVLDGERIDALPAHRRARAGVSRSFQNLELFEDLTVLENLAAASDERDAKAYLTNLVVAGEQRVTPAAAAAIAEFELEGDLDRKVSELSYGRRRLVAVARAVATRPSILLLDEPAAGLDESESREFSGLVRRLAAEWGIGVLVIEHDMGFIMGLCDRIVVLDFGMKIAEGAPADVRSDPAVVAAYLGVDEDHAGGPAVAESMMPAGTIS